jgi:L-iditol 2-dehydrogenase
MQASVLSSARSIGVEQVPVPSIRDDEVLVQIAAVGVCGSDTHY